MGGIEDRGASGGARGVGEGAAYSVGVGGECGGELRLRREVDDGGARRFGKAIEQGARGLRLTCDVFAYAPRCVKDEGEGEALDSGNKERGLHGRVVNEKRKVGGGESGDRLAAAVCNDDGNGDEVCANLDNLIVNLRADV